MNNIRKKYSYYEYRVYHAVGEIKHLNEVWEGWVYEIYTDCPLHVSYAGEVLKESDEWYETEDEAIKAVMDDIDRLESGPDEPDYDVEPYGVIDWDERRRMGE